MNHKRNYLLLLIALTTVLFISCDNTLTHITLTANTYMPAKTNQEISLSSNDDHGTSKVITEYIEGNKIQLRKLGKATTMVEQWEYENNGVYIIFSQEGFYEPFNSLNMASNRNELILKEPLKVGNTWNAESGNKYEITSINYPLETYAGNFDTIEVTSTDGTIIRKNYFAQNIGIIRTTIEFQDSSFIDSQLFSIQLSPYNPKDYRFYYYNIDKDEIVYTTEGVINYEPERMSFYIIKRLKEPTLNILPTIDWSVKINNIVPIYKKDFICVDFSKDFLNLSEKGVHVENALLQCIVNTFGYNFEVSNIIITIDGEPYLSDNILMEKGKPFKVDLSIGKEILR